MAYPISQEALNLFTKPYRQVVDISFYGLNNELQITDEDIILGGFSVNRYSVSGSKIEIGSVVAAEIELKLNNADGRFNSIQFEGAEMYVRVGTKKWDAHCWENAEYHYIPFGYFTVDKAPRKLEIITLTALDRMVLFDKTVDMSLLSFPMTVGDLLDRVCDICNVTLGTDIHTLPNHSYVIQEAPTSDDLTYRQLLSWIAELTGTCGFIDWNGQLILKWYEQTDATLTVRERFDSDIEENTIVITGVQVVAEKAVFLEGNDGYAFNIESNELIQHDHREVSQALYSILGGFSYTPFSATVKPMPHLYPLDVITFVDKNGINHSTIITDYTFTLNMSTALEGKGETATRSGYASANPLTKRETTIINNLKKEQNITLNSRIQAVLALNETVANSLGLFGSVKKDSNGSEVYYYHNSAALEDSSVIYTFREGGFAWTNDWNNGNPVWQYGISRDGNAVLNVLSAYKITTDLLAARSITADKLNVRLNDGSGKNLLTVADGGVKLSDWCIDENSIYHGNSFAEADIFLCTGSTSTKTIAGHKGSGWVFKAGDKFGINKLGQIYGTDVYLSGEINAKSGTIGKDPENDATPYWSIGSGGLICNNLGVDEASCITPDAIALWRNNAWFSVSREESNENYMYMQFVTGGVGINITRNGGKLIGDDWQIGSTSVNELLDRITTLETRLGYKYEG